MDFFFLKKKKIDGWAKKGGSKSVTTMNLRVSPKAVKALILCSKLQRPTQHPHSDVASLFAYEVLFGLLLLVTGIIMIRGGDAKVPLAWFS